MHSHGTRKKNEFSGELRAGEEHRDRVFLRMTDAARKKAEWERQRRKLQKAMSETVLDPTADDVENHPDQIINIDEEFYHSEEEEDEEEDDADVVQVVPPGSNDVGTEGAFNVNDFITSLSATHQISASGDSAWSKNLNGDTAGAGDSASSTPKATSRGKKSQRKSLTNPPKSSFGHASRLIETAEKLSKHVIVFGNPKCFDIFVQEMRRDLICAYSYRPIVYVGHAAPEGWTELSSQYDDIYWLRGDMTKSSDFNNSNAHSASSG